MEIIRQTKHEIDMRLDATLAAVDEACAAVAAFLDAAGVKRECFSLVVVLREALTNAVRHGNTSSEGEMIEASVAVRHDRCLVTVKDHGEGFDWRPCLERDPDDLSESGRGIPIMRHYCARVDFVPPGNEVRLEINRSVEPDMTQTDTDNMAATVVLEGDLVASAAEELRPHFKELVDQGARDLTIDFANAGMIDSLGMGLLIAAYNSVREQGGGVTLINVNDEIRDLLNTMRLNRHLTIA